MALRLRVVLCASIVLSVAAEGSAQPRDRAAADALFEAGRAAMAKGNYDEACPRFEESNRLDPAVGTVLNLAACKEKLGQVADAWQLYREALDRLPRGDDRIPFATDRLRSLEPKLAYLELTLADKAPPDTVVVKNGVQLGRASLGVPLVVNPGQHTIVVRAAGRVDRSFSIALSEGDKRDLRLELGPLQRAEERASASGRPAARPAELAPVETPRSADNRTLAYVLTGVGAAGLVATIVAGAMVLSQKQVVQEHCEDKLCDKEGFEAGETGKTFSTIGTLSFAVGVAGLGAGFYLLFTGEPSPERPAAGRAAFAGLRGTF